MDFGFCAVFISARNAIKINYFHYNILAHPINRTGMSEKHLVYFYERPPFTGKIGYRRHWYIPPAMTGLIRRRVIPLFDIEQHSHVALFWSVWGVRRLLQFLRALFSASLCILVYAYLCLWYPCLITGSGLVDDLLLRLLVCSILCSFPWASVPLIETLLELKVFIFGVKRCDFVVRMCVK
jgi:hypothetical protein